ncbi:MAG: NADH-quinone oxidoreductase subunit NuoE [Gammaproteobacteria bacterium]|nr:NADH-quinone oxidoreductase subunit NuoE [Gammaproteobacteria bacterium]MDH5591446.1 NADH-quinone oxidoreductase subunit NuoE [Gammaproteobacteria bacterium]
MSDMQLTGAKEHLFNADVRQQIDSWVAKYPAGQSQSAVIPSLHIVQVANDGWLSQSVMDALANYLSIPAISVYEVASFYTMFDLKPVGSHKVNVCTNISCMLNGSEEMVSHLEKRLGVKLGETTQDGRFTLKEVECLGACCGAPMMQLDRDYHEHLTTEKIDQILDGIK